MKGGRLQGRRWRGFLTLSRSSRRRRVLARTTSRSHASSLFSWAAGRRRSRALPTRPGPCYCSVANANTVGNKAAIMDYCVYCLYICLCIAAEGQQRAGDRDHGTALAAAEPPRDHVRLIALHTPARKQKKKSCNADPPPETPWANDRTSACTLHAPSTVPPCPWARPGLPRCFRPPSRVSDAGTPTSHAHASAHLRRAHAPPRRPHPPRLRNRTGPPPTTTSPVFPPPT